MKTIEEKARAYDEAYKVAEGIHRFSSDLAEIKLMEGIFPELKESEDKRIRKAIHIYLDWLDGRKDYAPRGEYTIRDMIAWIEKQGEQKPAWSEKDKDSMYDTLSNLTELKDRYGEGYGNVGKCIDWLKSLKERVQPQLKQEWSEEDDDNMIIIEDRLSDYLDYIREDSSLTKHQKNSLKEEVIGYVDWLKSLKGRYTWKPSEEQIEAVQLARSFVTDDFAEKPTLSDVLVELEKQLKKLREE